MPAAEKATLTLKQTRIRTGIGREKCSVLSGVNRVLILRYENGMATPGIVNAAKIARVLGVGLHEVEEFKHAAAEAETVGLTTANPARKDSAGRRA